MPERLLRLDDLKTLTSPDGVAALFHRLGYDAEAQPLNLEDLQLTSRSAEAVFDAYLIADQGNGGLQVLLFHNWNRLKSLILSPSIPNRV